MMLPRVLPSDKGSRLRFMKKRQKGFTGSSVSRAILLISSILALAMAVVAALGSQISSIKEATIGPDPVTNKTHLSANVTAASVRPMRSLSLADRVAYQYAIEEVFWRHRIWPQENARPKPSLDEVMSPFQVQEKVRDSLRNSQLLADHGKPITPEQLQAEMERMAKNTKQPDVLRELFAALGSDPVVIAECLARPVLADRLVKRLSLPDQQLRGEMSQIATKQISRCYTLPEIGTPSTSCAPDSWLRIENGAPPDPRESYTVVWTGTEMIVWGGNTSGSVNSGGRYNPSTDSWVATSTSGAPAGRNTHTAVWTGSEMIVWGGENAPGSVLNSGGKYNPSTDSWVTTSTIGAPMARDSHTAVWTGNEMIVWGGRAGGTDYFNSGGRYDPGTDSWVATSTIGAPMARYDHTAVWTGNEVIVWGGRVGGGDSNSGGRYNPSTDSWVATANSGAPSARGAYTVVWTGTEMIVWGGTGPIGGSERNTGGRYNPSTDSWVATSTNGAPSARFGHTAVWTDNEMIIWGGYGGFATLNSGGRYNPSTDSWVATNTSGAPNRRTRHTAVWTGGEMIVWGGVGPPAGVLNSGGRYDPTTDSWVATNSGGAPDARYGHTAVWTGSEMIVWGGTVGPNELNSGGRYNPSVDSWIAITANGAPAERYRHTVVWTGVEMIVWGGTAGSGELNSGGRYNPNTDSWVATNTSGAPTARHNHTAIWTGSEMIIWGGNDGSSLNTGGRYDPIANSWVAPSTTGAPTARFDHTAVWTGSEMIIWGGNNGSSLNSGGKYNPGTNSWVATSSSGAPTAREGHTTVWTGFEMIVWGGVGNGDVLNSGGRYTPNTDSWAATSISGAPGARSLSTAVWTGSEMIVWGGLNALDEALNNGGRYSPSTNSWIVTTTSGAPTARFSHTAVWTGSEMIVWGGYDNFTHYNTGGKYCSGTIITPTPTATPTASPSPTASPMPTPSVTPSPSPGGSPTILGNISTRIQVGTGNNVLIAGFIVSGTQPKKVIARAIGPSLPFSGVLANPFLELRDSSGTLIRSDDDWRTGGQEQEIMDTLIPPTNDLESAVVETLPANNAAYTAVVSGVTGGTGVGLIELYDLDHTVDSKFANISTRGLVQTGNDVMIAGTIVLGSTPQHVLIRGLGPSLPLSGVLANPSLELRDSSGTVIRACDDWHTCGQEGEIIATGLPPTNDAESAILADLSAGAYTAIVSGVNNTTGVALVEIYALTN